MQQRIIRNGRKRRDAVSGFTLIEALVAIALMGVILAALASITSQWLPNWNRGIARAQRSELVRVALDRLIADYRRIGVHLAEPRYKSPVVRWNGIFCHPCTVGNRAQYPSWSRNRAHIAEIDDKGGQVLVRATKPFAPGALTTTALQQPDFANQAVLLRSPYQVSFAYAGPTEFGKRTGRMPISYPQPFD